MSSRVTDITTSETSSRQSRTLCRIPAQDFEVALMSMPIRWTKYVTVQGEYFEGHHLAVDLGVHSLEVVFTQDEDEHLSGSESQEEAEADPPSDKDVA